MFEVLLLTMDKTMQSHASSRNLLISTVEICAINVGTRSVYAEILRVYIHVLSHVTYILSTMMIPRIVVRN